MRANPFDLLGSPLARSAPGVTRERPISVSDLAAETRVLVESGLQPVWVRGEITDFKRHRNGHWYLAGFDHTRGEERSFRLDRITGTVTRVGEPGAFERPGRPSEGCNRTTK